MTGFILFALVLITLAVLIVVPVLLRKNHPIDDEYDGFNVAIAKDRLKEIKQQHEAGEINEESYQQLHDELEAALAVDLAVDQSNTQQNNNQGADDLSAGKKKLSAIVIALSIPVISAAVYSQLGDFDAATGQPVVEAQFVQPVPATNVVGAPQMGGAGSGEKSELTMEEAAAGLEQRLLASPGNPEGWFMLARTYMVMKKYHKAKAAYEKTIELAGDKPDILLRYVDAVAMTEGGSLNGAAKPILEKVIGQLPNNPMALWLAGTAESQQGNYKMALTHWYKLRPLLNGSVNDQTELNKLINGAESNFTPVELAALKKALAVVDAQPVRMPSARPVSAPSGTAKAASTGAAEIRVIVDLDPALKDKVSPSDTLFVFAKALQGPPMPLAAVKKTVADLPLKITLNDAMAMMPQMKLSNFENVKVSAVVSKSGQPGAKQGDLFVEVFPVKVAAAEEIILLINQVK
ncbi:Cytochrome c heme lyase subunit CcmH [hydrothermal vent metagenome]|uniref:Cytochrome c heme lyase subunit CcmH n=1 Tax=hydrothermal vent metagenome TaxID=652676 RepID=A0A3B0XZJ8_9ZZZZ